MAEARSAHSYCNPATMYNTEYDAPQSQWHMASFYRHPVAFVHLTGLDDTHEKYAGLYSRGRDVNGYPHYSNPEGMHLYRSANKKLWLVRDVVEPNKDTGFPCHIACAALPVGECTWLYAESQDEGAKCTQEKMLTMTEVNASEGTAEELAALSTEDLQAKARKPGDLSLRRQPKLVEFYSLRTAKSVEHVRDGLFRRLDLTGEEFLG
eukprot:SAG11_NODE_467_length_9212_cov_2.153627_8_plen_208_part_00